MTDRRAGKDRTKKRLHRAFTVLCRQAAALLLLVPGGFLVPGARAQQVTMRGLDGPAYNLSQSRGHVVAFLFGAVSAPMTAESAAAFQKLADHFAERDVEFYWVSINSETSGSKGFASDADLRSFAAQNSLRMRVLRDPDQAALRALGVNATPAVVIIDRSGQVQHRIIGFDPSQPRPYREVGRAIRQLLRAASGRG